MRQIAWQQFFRLPLNDDIADCALSFSAAAVTPAGRLAADYAFATAGVPRREGRFTLHSIIDFP
jgi:hypothetical protein